MTELHSIHEGLTAIIHDPKGWLILETTCKDNGSGPQLLLGKVMRNNLPRNLTGIKSTILTQVGKAQVFAKFFP